MLPFDRKLWKNAARIGTAIQEGRHTRFLPALPMAHVQDLSRLHRQWGQARERSWSAAAARARQALGTRMQWVINDLQRFVIDEQRPADEPTASTAELYRDLQALKAEFDAVVIDQVQQTVTVTTGRILLEDIDLGRFEVVWHWSRIDADDELQVIPLEPCWSESDEVCHPHVRDNTLCIGEGEVPLQRAFHAGRLFDAFLILRQILQTYNPQSAYAALANWNSEACDTCGAAIPDDESGSCERCHTVLCEECQRSCIMCGDALCSDCRKICPTCHEPVCSRCRPVFTGPQSQLCQHCYDEELGSDEDHSEDEPSPTPAASTCSPANAALFSHGVGEAPVSAGCGEDGDRRLRD